MRMLERPDLADGAILAALHTAYGIAARRLDFLPLGNDATAWVFRVDSEHAPPLFLKVKLAAVSPASLLVPRHLKDHGVIQVVAPHPTLAGDLSASADGFTLVLYPFIDGKAGTAVGLSNAQWIEFGALARQIHACPVPDELRRTLRKESFIPKWGGLVRQLQQHVGERCFDDPLQEELARFWGGRHAAIDRIVRRAEALGEMMQHQDFPCVLCHADMHTANLLINAEGRLFLVDWDETLLAPKERDLMYVVNEAVGGMPVAGSEEAFFFQGYTSATVDPLALAYYRYEWVVQELGDYGERVFLMSGLGVETRQASVREFLQLFEPGDVVEGAYQSERYLTG